MSTLVLHKERGHSEIRELSMEEINEVHGGVAPIVTYGAAALTGLIIGFLANWLSP